MRAAERQTLLFLSVAAVLGAGALSAPARAEMVRYDFEGPLFSEPPQPILDHSVVEKDGVYHLFYLRGNPAVNIGHATTTDFVHWNQEPPVLTLGSWDNKAMWAPCLLQVPNGSWGMYYTGVNLQNSQQSGAAWSSNLVDWFKWPASAIYHPDPVWAEWTENGFAHGRDPHVLEYNGRYYMFVTAKTLTNRGAVASAVSDDLINWDDIGPLYVHDSWHVLESVFLLQRPNGKWHMFFTEETVNGTSHMYSDSLLSGWDIGTRRIVDGGHAPQITDSHLGQMFSRHAVYNDFHGNQRYVIRFTPMTWLNDQAVVPRLLPLSPEWTFVGTGDAFFYQPTYDNNAFVRNELYPTTFLGKYWINTYEYYTGPLGFGFPGQFIGDTRTGMIRSPAFTIEGNSMSFLIGGGDYPDDCYVALVDAQTEEVIFRETGRNSNEMDRRYWSLSPHIGRSVYLEIADLATGPFGHICVDDIAESGEVILPGTGSPGRTRQIPNQPGRSEDGEALGLVTRLLPNTPNPFNPSTTIVFELGHDADAHIDVFDARGAHIRTLASGRHGAGPHRVAWDGTNSRAQSVASGVYFYRLTVDGRAIETRKMALLK